MTDAAPAGASLVLMVTTVNRSAGRSVTRLFTEAGVTFNLAFFGRGTATRRIMDYLGLGETDKLILLSTMPLEQSRSLLQRLTEKLRLDQPGHGIALTLPIAGVCGAETARLLRGSYQVESREPMEQTFENRMLVAVVNRGFADDVMAAARTVAPVGGTVLHGRGAAQQDAETFFGMTIHPEKELVLILTPGEYGSDIMRAIATRAGIHTEAHAIVFSLPVIDVAGLPALFQDQSHDQR